MILGVVCQRNGGGFLGRHLGCQLVGGAIVSILRVRNTNRLCFGSSHDADYLKMMTNKLGKSKWDETQTKKMKNTMIVEVLGPTYRGREMN